jgi:cbb3-type cytochrome oxidase maturation protein
MTAIIVLIVCSLIVAGGFLFAFLFSVKSGQYDDTYTPAVRMLFDDHGNDEVIKDSDPGSKQSFNDNQEEILHPEKIQNPKP